MVARSSSQCWFRPAGSFDLSKQLALCTCAPISKLPLLKIAQWCAHDRELPSAEKTPALPRQDDFLCCRERLIAEERRRRRGNGGSCVGAAARDRPPRARNGWEYQRRTRRGAAAATRIAVRRRPRGESEMLRTRLRGLHFDCLWFWVVVTFP